MRNDPKQHELAAEANAELKQALAELRELARGLHPQVLTTGGLAPALEQLAERSAIPVDVSAAADRYPDEVESTAYFVASEALANVAKYARRAACTRSPPNAETAASRSRSQTTASAAPTPTAAPASPASPTGSPR